MGAKAEISRISALLTKEIIDRPEEPDVERTNDLLQQLEKYNIIPVAILESTGVGKVLSKCIKSIKRHNRTSEGGDKFDAIISSAEAMLRRWKDSFFSEEAARRERQGMTKEEEREGLPCSVKVYQRRLVKQGKDLYKNPPALPPVRITVESDWVGPPKRNAKTGELSFTCGLNKNIEALLHTFHPNRTPEEILRGGAFGGTYFRPIVSAVTNVRYNPDDVLAATVESSWIDGLEKKTMLTSSTYCTTINKFGVKCGGSLGMWESSGWISDADPYGWFQWYCRFYRGRRCSDDERQIARWSKSAGFKGRFRSQLCNKILSANTTFDDMSISPVIRQTLLHWGFEVTKHVLDQHKRR